MARIGGTEVLTPTPATTIALTIDPTVPQIICRWTAAQNETININGTPSDGQSIILLITNDNSARTITFGTKFLAKGTLVGVANKKSVVCFVADNDVFLECSRTIGM